jgi:hypothetical protein
LIRPSKYFRWYPQMSTIPSPVEASRHQLFSQSCEAGSQISKTPDVHPPRRLPDPLFAGLRRTRHSTARGMLSAKPGASSGPSPHFPRMPQHPPTLKEIRQ